MKVLGIIRKENARIEDLYDILTIRECLRVSDKSPEYRLSSGLCRALLFLMCEDYFDIPREENAVEYHPHPRGEKASGAPYLPGRPDLFISLSHTDTACAVLISDEGACGVDIENLSHIFSYEKERLSAIRARMYLDDFSGENAFSMADLTTVVYKFEKRSHRILKQTMQSFFPFDLKKEDEYELFCALYTRMEAVGKATGLGVSFLCEREKYDDINTLTLTDGELFISVAM